MVKLTFSGTIHPTAITVSVNDMPNVNWNSPELNLEMVCRTKIENNNVLIDCDVDNFDPERHFTPIVMRAYDVARSTVDLLSFATGNGFSFILDTYTDHSGVTTAVASKQPELTVLSTIMKRTGAFDTVLRLVLTEPPLFLALRDLIEATTQWHRAPINAARVLDALRNMIAPGQKPETGWLALRNALRLEKDYLKYVTDQSAPPRHGDVTHIPGSITQEVAKRAWTVFNRYLEYRVRGATSLPLSEFPVL